MTDGEKALELIASYRRVICSYAPTYRIAFGEKADASLVALQRLGISGVSETALGARTVHDEVARQLESTPCLISTACPSVVRTIHAHYPDLVPLLSEVKSPLYCHCELLYRTYGKDIGILFIGPCPMKKKEAQANPGFPHVALTFREFLELLENKGIVLESIQEELAAGLCAPPQFIPRGSGSVGTHLEAGGTIASIQQENRIGMERHSCSGSTAVRVLLERLNSGQENRSGYFELFHCGGGCAGRTRQSYAMAPSIFSR